MIHTACGGGGVSRLVGRTFVGRTTTVITRVIGCVMVVVAVVEVAVTDDRGGGRSL